MFFLCYFFVKRWVSLAFPQHVIDIPNASGKVIVPSNHWKHDTSFVKDFAGKCMNTITWQEERGK